MHSRFFQAPAIEFTNHPKFAGVKIAVLVAGKDTGSVGVSQLEIAPGVAVPVHTHEEAVDSIFVLEGRGEALVNGQWQAIAPGDYLFVPADVEHGVRNTGKDPLRLFVHHSPPVF